jgi:hypothetical protein
MSDEDDDEAMFAEIKRAAEEAAQKRANETSEKNDDDKAKKARVQALVNAARRIEEDVYYWLRRCSDSVPDVKQTSKVGRRSYSIHGIDITVKVDTRREPFSVSLALQWTLRGGQSHRGTYKLCDVVDAADDPERAAAVKARLSTIVGELVTKVEQSSRVDYLAVTLDRP